MSPNFTDYQCVIPFRMVDKLIIIEANINGITGFLSIDTGIEGLVIHEKYFNAGKAENTIVSSNGRTVGVGSTYAIVEFACLSKKFRNAQVMNLDHLTSNPVARVIGLVGWDMFQSFELQIDFRNRVLRLFELDVKGDKISGSIVPVPVLKTLPFRFKGPIPFVEASIGDEKVHLMLDTGASVNVLNKTLKKHLASYSRFLRMIRLRQWSGDSEIPLTEVSGVNLGGIQLSSMNTVWYDISRLNCDLEGPEMDGILGQEFMKQYLVAMNFINREVSFSHYASVAVDDIVIKIPEISADR
jgi:hypothetical protein